MKRLQSSFTNMVVALVAVAMISGALLSIVNHVTEGPIARQEEMKLTNGINSVMGSSELTVTSEEEITKDVGGKNASFIIHKVADADGNFMGAAVESSSLGFNGNIKVLVGFDAQGKVLGYTILEASETPGLGAKASTWFQSGAKGDIIGRQLSADNPLTVSKDGGDVDAITASTITSRAFLNAINQAYGAYSDQDVDGMTGASQQY